VQSSKRVEDAKFDRNFRHCLSSRVPRRKNMLKKCGRRLKLKWRGLTHFTSGNAIIDKRKQAKIDLNRGACGHRDALKSS